jgi:hypothetical protein
MSFRRSAIGPSFAFATSGSSSTRLKSSRTVGCANRNANDYQLRRPSKEERQGREARRKTHLEEQPLRLSLHRLSMHQRYDALHLFRRLEGLVRLKVGHARRKCGFVGEALFVLNSSGQISPRSPSSGERGRREKAEGRRTCSNFSNWNACSRNETADCSISISSSSSSAPIPSPSPSSSLPVCSARRGTQSVSAPSPQGSNGKKGGKIRTLLPLLRRSSGLLPHIHITLTLRVLLQHPQQRITEIHHRIEVPVSSQKSSYHYSVLVLRVSSRARGRGQSE